MDASRGIEAGAWPDSPPLSGSRLSLLEQLQPRRVVVVRALRGLGDLLCAVPALRALRAALPDASIALVGLPSARDFVARFDRYLDELLEFPGFPGIVERPFDARATSDFFATVQATEFDLAVQLHGSGLATNPFTVLLGARRTAGFYLPGLYCPDPETFWPYPEHESEVWRQLRLVQALGAPFAGDHLEWPVTARDREALEAAPDLAALPAEAYACVHAGANEPSRQWPAERFAAVADWLATRGLQVVLTGTEGETAVVDRVAAKMQQPYLRADGRTSLGALGALLAGARVVVTNDTGTSHLAAALAVPSVVLFMASERARWAPLDRARHRGVGRGASEQHPCHEVSRGMRCLKDGCTLPGRLDARSTDLPSVEAVLDELADLLA